MRILLTLLMATPAALGLLVLVALAIERFAARPEDSALRRAVDQTCRVNGLRSTRIRIASALFLIAISVLLFLAATHGSGWAGLGGSWFSYHGSTDIGSDA